MIAIFFWILVILHCTLRYAFTLVFEILCYCVSFTQIFLFLFQEAQPSDQGHSLYSRFYISGRDIAAFFMDCGSESQTCTLASSSFDSLPSPSPDLGDADNFYSLVDRCGMAVIVDQV